MSAGRDDAGEPFSIATDAEGRVSAWSAGAEELLGFPPARALGAPIQELLEPRDLFGNRACILGPNVEEMVRRGEPIRPFVVDVRAASGHATRVVVHAIAPAGGADSPRALEYRMRADHRSVSERREFDQKAVGSLLRSARSNDSPGGTALTPAELKVLKLLAAGHGTERIASLLKISPATVRNHVQHVRRKLDVHTRLEAVSVALRNGLV